jgi:hypothetical protein
LATAAIGSRRLWVACRSQRVKKVRWPRISGRIDPTEKHGLRAADLDGGALVHE